MDDAIEHVPQMCNANDIQVCFLSIAIEVCIRPLAPRLPVPVAQLHNRCSLSNIMRYEPYDVSEPADNVDEIKVNST